MMTNDSIADLLTRIRNANEREKSEIVIPASKMLKAIIEILQKEGFLEGYEVEKGEIHDNFIVRLKYVNGLSAISELKRISKPGLRKYVGYREIPKVRNGLGISIISTSKGVMSGSQARKEKLGGEILATIY